MNQRLTTALPWQCRVNMETAHSQELKTTKKQHRCPVIDRMKRTWEDKGITYVFNKIGSNFPFEKYEGMEENVPGKGL